MLAGLWGLSSVAAEGPAFRVIVNAANPVNEITREQAATLFLERRARWSHGATVSPVDQSTTSAVRESFSTEVLGRPVMAVQAYWQQRILAAREIPPPVKSGDDDVIAHVGKNKGGIGYVSGDAALPPTVKLVRIR